MEDFCSCANQCYDYLIFRVCLQKYKISLSRLFTETKVLFCFKKNSKGSIFRADYSMFLETYHLCSLQSLKIHHVHILQ